MNATLQEYAVHVLSTACEWLMCLMFLLYFLTFHMEFRQISLDVSVKARYHHTDIVGTINEKTPLKTWSVEVTLFKF